MRMMRRNWFRWALIVILLAVTHTLWLPLPARLLVVRDEIGRADAIAVLSGDGRFDREARAAELYKNGAADKIIRILEKNNPGFELMARLLNPEATQELVYSRYFESAGVSRDSVILGGMVATSTFNELKAVRAIALKNNFKTIILVTSDYHMRRALMTAGWVFRGSGVKVRHSTIYSRDFHPARWWLHEADIRAVVFEYLGIGFYAVYHFALGK